VREHLIRSLAGIASMYCFFYTLAHMRLADAVLLNYSLPIFIPFVESVWLGEEFPRRLWIPVVVGFLGVIVILRPGSGLMEPVALLGVASRSSPAVAQVGSTAADPHGARDAHRLLLRDHRHLPVRAAHAVSWRTPHGFVWLAAAAMGLTATLGQLAMTAPTHTHPRPRSARSSTRRWCSRPGLDWLFWRKLPDAFTVAGGVLVVAAGILSLRLNPAEAEVETPATV
jgi:drug/metabolite transporter (DMT)-like permease